MRDNRLTWWFWVPALPKPLIVGAWALFLLLSLLLPYAYYYFNPGQPLLVSVIQGLGGNSIGMFTWSIIAIQLNAEVFYMIFTRKANERAVEKAAEQAEKLARAETAEIRAEAAEARTEVAKARMEAAEARTEAAETRTEAAEVRAEAAKTRTEAAEARAETLAWYERQQAAFREGRPFDEPPPFINGNGSDAGNSDQT